MRSEKDMSKIGIFDSGLGGLSVWKEIVSILPHTSLVYVADSGRCPYGPQPVEDIRRYAREITELLISQGCELVVVACNTATAAAIKDLRAEYPIPFVGMEPAIKPAAQATASRVVGILATEGTFRGQHFQRARDQFAANTELILQVGHGLVEFVEQGTLQGQEVETCLRSFLEPMLEAGADQIVLGCSHYPFLRSVMEQIVSHKATIIDPAPAVAEQTARLWRQLPRVELASPPSYAFYTSGSPDRLRSFLSLIGEEEIQEASCSYSALVNLY